MDTGSAIETVERCLIHWFPDTPPSQRRDAARSTVAALHVAESTGMGADPIDAHRALQKTARELAFYADHGHAAEYLAAIDHMEEKLRAVRSLAR